MFKGLSLFKRRKIECLRGKPPLSGQKNRYFGNSLNRLLNYSRIFPENFKSISAVFTKLRS